MKKLLLTLLLILTIGAVSVRAEETVLYTCLFGDGHTSDKIGSYTQTWTATTDNNKFTIVNFNNNNIGWNYIKCGSKSGASVASITTAFAAPEPITKVAVTIDAITANKINSITLQTSADNKTWTDVNTYTKDKGVQTVTLPNPQPNLYYRIKFNCQKATSNGTVQVSKVEYYGDGGLNEPNLSFGETTSYKVALGSEFTAPILNKPEGLNVTYSSSEEKVATVDTETGAVTIKGLGVTEIKATSKETTEYYAGSASYTIIVFDPNAKEDDLNAEVLGLKGNGYDTYTHSSIFADYSTVALNNEGIQWTTSNASNGNKVGIIGNSKRYRAVSVTVEFNSIDKYNKLNVYGATSPYESSEVLKDKTAIGTIDGTANKTVTYTFPSDSKYTSFGLRPNVTNAVKITSIKVKWSALPTATPVFTENLPGVYEEIIDIYIECPDKDAKIYYTLDGSTPTTESELYEDYIIIEESATVKAIALLDGFPASEVLEGKYIINPAGTELEENQVLVDFTNPASLYKFEGNQVVPFTAETGADLSGVELAHPYSHVTVTPSAGSYNGHVKAHSGATLVFKAYNKNKITKIEINGENLHNLSFASHVIGDPVENTVNAAAETSNLTGDSAKQTYEPGNDAGASSVVLTANDAANIHNVKVTTKAGQSTGVDEIFTEDADAPARYFNLQGVEVNPENLPAGLYIIKQGSKTFKAIVK